MKIKHAFRKLLRRRPPSNDAIGKAKIREEIREEFFRLNLRCHATVELPPDLAGGSTILAHVYHGVVVYLTTNVRSTVGFEKGDVDRMLSADELVVSLPKIEAYVAQQFYRTFTIKERIGGGYVVSGEPKTGCKEIPVRFGDGYLVSGEHCWKAGCKTLDEIPALIRRRESLAGAEELK